jgi:hypothetical protein
MNRWENFTRYARQRTTQVMNWYISPSTLNKYKSCHTNLNKLRVRLATSKDCTLVRIPPSESAFKQHVLRASIQTKTWMTSHQAKPPVASPYDYGWQKGYLFIFFSWVLIVDYIHEYTYYIILYCNHLVRPSVRSFIFHIH